MNESGTRNPAESSAPVNGKNARFPDSPRGSAAVLRRSVCHLDYRWKLPPEVNPEAAARLSAKAGVPEGVARVALRRAGGDVGRAERLLEHGPPGDPLGALSSGAEEQVSRAVRRIRLAAKRGEAVGIYADYDSDGVTAAVILREALELAGVGPVFVYFPSRFGEGYGFHRQGVRYLAELGATLVVTVDCGIAGGTGFREAAELGLDVIVTDHHIPGHSLPLAVALVNPRMSEWAESGLEDLSGAGVAYVLASRLISDETPHGGLEREDGVREVYREWLGLVCLSIAADGVSVAGQHRPWVQAGLEVLARSQKPGIRALAQVAGLSGRRFDFERDVMFGLVPRLNAAGRMKEARLAFDLLVAGEKEEALRLASALDELNTQRKAVEERITEECLTVLEERGDPAEQTLLTAWSRSWHPGVIGVVASRLKEAFWRPVALAGGGPGALRGSVRAIPGFDVWAGLSCCSKHLETWGGHKEAGGFSVSPDRIEAFFADLRRYAEESVGHLDLRPEMVLDDCVSGDDLSGPYLAGLLKLEPFGPGNPRPLIGVRGAAIRKVEQRSGNGLEIHISGSSGVPLRCYWRNATRPPELLVHPAGRADLVLSPGTRVTRGREEISIEIVDAKEEGFGKRV